MCLHEKLGRICTNAFATTAQLNHTFSAMCVVKIYDGTFVIIILFLRVINHAVFLKIGIKGLLQDLEFRIYQMTPTFFNLPFRINSFVCITMKKIVSDLK